MLIEKVNGSVMLTSCGMPDAEYYSILRDAELTFCGKRCNVRDAQSFVGLLIEK